MKSKIIIFNILPITLFALILAVSALVLYEVKKNPSNQNLINSQLIGKKIPTIKIEKIDFFQQKVKDHTLNIDKYKNEVAFGAWLKRIVINQSIDEIKKKKLELIAFNEEVFKIENENDWQIESTSSIDEIVSIINQLKDKYRLVLTMYLLEGFDHQEISEILKITETTSRTHLLRGKRLLKEQLKNTGYAEGY